MQVEDYVLEIGQALEGCQPSIERAVEVLKESRRIWTLGNGGSLAVAQHFAQDLLKTAGRRAQAMNDPSVLTAWANDHAFEYSFYGPLQVLSEPGDSVVIFSCSGKSRNYIEFISQGVFPLIAVVGTDGGFLKEKANVSIHVKSDDYQICESAFSIVADMLLRNLMAGKGEQDA